MINCIAVEDEPMALKKLESFISDVPFLSLQASFSSSLNALNYLTTHTPDLLFLDIQMDKLNGIQLLESLPNKPRVIITTAFHEYALKAYELEVIDYLLKPYPFERFMQAVVKARELIGNPVREQKTGTASDLIFVKTAYQIERVFLNDILYVEGMKDYLGIVTRQKRLMCLQNFTSLMNILPENDFVRVHKSWVVALNKIESISNHRIHIGDQIIPVSESYQKAFYLILKTHGRLL
ncbi:MAG: response regulator transcription factor [Bacteroidales bacterium]|nr:response regulator transcription factor [Bacteroidales bacterium]